MSADIVGSTALYESLGDTRAQTLVADILASLKAACDEHGGRTIAEIGDQVIAVFDDPSEAAAAASEIHIDLHEQHRDQAGPRIRMRVGLHYGPMLSGGDDLTGETVKVAQWAASNAKPEQTLATRALVDQLPRILRSVSRYVDDETWNFVSLEHVELYEVIWDVESITAYAGEKPSRDGNGYERVVLSYGDQSVTVNATQPVASIGRHHSNDLVVDKDLVSRQHLSAQFSRGRCTITDNSTNGSLIRLDGGEEFELKRESFRLNGSGLIIPGRPEHADAEFAVRFRCE